MSPRDVPLAKNPSTGTARQRLFLVLKVVLHAVVVISEVLRLSTKSRCSRCCRHISSVTICAGMFVSSCGPGVPSGASKNSVGSTNVRGAGLLASIATCDEGGTQIEIPSHWQVAAFMKDWTDVRLSNRAWHVFLLL